MSWRRRQRGRPSPYASSRAGRPAAMPTPFRDCWPKTSASASPKPSSLITALAGGQIHFAFDSLGSALPLIQAGKIKALAVTGQQRLGALASVPTTAEAGYAAVVTDVWMGLFVPAKTPRNVLNAVHAEA